MGKVSHVVRTETGGVRHLVAGHAVATGGRPGRRRSRAPARSGRVRCGARCHPRPPPRPPGRRAPRAGRRRGGRRRPRRSCRRGSPKPFTTFESPSAPQKRACAKGRSIETSRIVVLSRLPAASLNRRTLAAHVGVSMLGKMLSTTRWPARSLRLTVDRSPFTRVNAGAACPSRAGLRGVDGVASYFGLGHGSGPPTGLRVQRVKVARRPGHRPSKCGGRPSRSAAIASS